MISTGAFRENRRVEKLLQQISREASGKYFFMEVCGGHTTAIRRYGIQGLLPSGIRLIPGPGCPVCVTSKTFIDHAIALSTLPGIIIATFGDLLRVPGSHSSLEKAKANGAAVRVIYSVIEAINLAEKYKNNNIVFLAIGFETTAPGNAYGVLVAGARSLGNFFILSAQKIMPPAMRAVVTGGTPVNGFICPGHVSAITGTGIYEFLPREFGIGCVISGFEPVDILLTVLMLIRQVNRDAPEVENEYGRAVSPDGNTRALRVMDQVYTVRDEWWRGFGVIPESGLQLQPKFERFDAGKIFPLEPVQPSEDKTCICGEILRGVRSPAECPLFGTGCTPDDPAGACMISAEGACLAFFKYDRASDAGKR